MADDLITLRTSELREYQREAWVDGFDQGHLAGQGREYAGNPYEPPARCEWPGCSLLVTGNSRVCAEHFRQAANLLAPRKDRP